MKRKFILFILGLIGIVTFALSQSVDTIGISEGPFPGGELTAEGLVKAYHIIYGALVIVWGYIAKMLKVKYNWNLKKNFFPFIVLAGGIVLASAFIMFGFGKVLPYLFGFLGAIGVYDIILKPSGLNVKNKEVVKAAA